MFTLEQLIFEEAVTINDALSDNFGLVLTESADRVYFILFDINFFEKHYKTTNKRKLLPGLIKAGIAVDKDVLVPTVVRSAAESGYGPLIYDIAMSEFRYLTSDSDVSKDALKVWNYYFYKRNDVKKTELWRIDEEFETNKLSEFEGVTGIDRDDPIAVSVKYAFTLNSKIEINGLIDNADVALKKLKFSKYDFMELFKMYFDEKRNS